MFTQIHKYGADCVYTKSCTDNFEKHAMTVKAVNVIWAILVITVRKGVSKLPVEF